MVLPQQWLVRQATASLEAFLETTRSNLRYSIARYDELYSKDIFGPCADLNLSNFFD